MRPACRSRVALAPALNVRKMFHSREPRSRICLRNCNFAHGQIARYYYNFSGNLKIRTLEIDYRTENMC